MEKIGVLGAGTMGAGIAQVAALAGYEVQLVDVAQGQLDRALATIHGNLTRSVEKGRIGTEELDSTLSRLHPATELSSVAGCGVVIEAVQEEFQSKSHLLESLDSICPPETLFASNTSSISITRLAACTDRPDRMMGLHFFNPVPAMKLVEAVRGLRTSEETRSRLLELVRSLGKTPVEVEDFPGFISNRLLMPMINEAAYALMEGVAGRDAIDAVMKLGMNHPMGPLELADLIGLDVCLDIMRVLHDGFGDSKYRPCPLLIKMVAAGHLGKKAGQGFYDYHGRP
ncbi:MAG TPA: 3-hydroxybutyryl-CoA dehydrogenase [Chloroflexota bacterium]|nr:3-hydroxybutyryl-CoA dehydrogenase [Chloroflexota bacterium]